MLRPFEEYMAFDFDWAVETATDNEPATVEIMNKYLKDNGYENDFTDTRLHHEIYMSDARKVDPSKWKTVIRHPIKKITKE